MRTSLFLLIALLLSGSVLAQATEPYVVLKLPIPQQATPLDPSMHGPWTRVINNTADWTAFYETSVAPFYPPGSEYRDIPVLDFTKYTLIMGGLSGTGIELMIEKVNDSSLNLFVSYLILSPESGCNVAQQVLFPMKAILVEKTSKQVRFFGHYAYHACGL